MNKRKFSMMLAAAMVMVLFIGLGMASGADLDTYIPEPIIKFASASAKPGDVISIPISITEPTGLAGYGFAIQYDNNVLIPANTIQAGTASGVGVPVYNPAYSSNKIFLTWADADAIDSNGSLAVLSFTVKNSAKSGSTLLVWDAENIFVNGTDGADITSTFDFTRGTIDIIGGGSHGGGGGGGGAVVSVTFNGVSVKNAPQKVTYNEGEALDLTGLIVTLEYSDGSSKDVTLIDFDEHDITVSPGKGTILDVADTQLVIEVNGKTATQNITVNKATPPAPSANPPEIKLSDIDGHWAEANIERLAQKGYIAGYTDGTFQPDETITRAEFTTLIVKAFDLQADNEKVFNDTANHWAKKYISAAAANRTVLGYNDQEFGPDESITREQMAIMIVNAAAAKPKAGELPYRDGADISLWALSWVTTAVHNDLMSGYPDNTFRPQANATRAEAVTVIINALGAERS